MIREIRLGIMVYSAQLSLMLGGWNQAGRKTAAISATIV